MTSEDVEKEYALCKKLYHQNKGGCHWGACKNCGLIPALHKLSTGEVLEDELSIRKLKERVFADEKYL